MPHRRELGSYIANCWPETRFIPASELSVYIALLCESTSPVRRYLESSETKGVKPMSFGMDWHSRSLRLINLALLFLVIAPAALAQTNWTQLAPFPEPNEEILGVPAGGKLYVMA